MNNRILYFVLLFLVVFNTLYILYYRIYITRRFDHERQLFMSDTTTNVSLLITNALNRIDTYFLSRSSSSPSLPSVSTDIGRSAVSTNLVRLTNFGTWAYRYYSVDGISHARVANLDYTVGDLHPYGGIITHICPDSVHVDGVGYYQNSRRDSANVSPLTITNTKYESTTNTLR